MGTRLLIFAAAVTAAVTITGPAVAQPESCHGVLFGPTPLGLYFYSPVCAALLRAQQTVSAPPPITATHNHDTPPPIRRQYPPHR